MRSTEVAERSAGWQCALCFAQRVPHQSLSVLKLAVPVRLKGLQIVLQLLLQSVVTLGNVQVGLF